LITLKDGKQTIKEELLDTVEATIEATGRVPDWVLTTSKVLKAEKVNPASIKNKGPKNVKNLLQQDLLCATPPVNTQEAEIIAEFLAKMLHPDPSRRPTLQEVLEFARTGASEHPLSGT